MKIRHGPAAVIGDENRSSHFSIGWEGAASSVIRESEDLPMGNISRGLRGFSPGLKGMKYGIHGADSRFRGFFYRMGKTIFLVRHGETEGNRQHRFVGSTDLPLNGNGRRQALSLKPLVGSLDFGRCICSPYLRCRETAGILLGDSPVQPSIDERIREADFGRWEGLTFGEISESYVDDLKRWAALADDFSFPHGESLRDFLARVRSFAADVTRLQEERVLLVTHGGVMRFLLCQWLQLDFRHHIIFDIALAALTTVRLYSGGGLLVGFNERAPAPDLT